MIVMMKSHIEDLQMTQAHKQQYKYKVTGDSFKHKSPKDLKIITLFIIFSIGYLMSRV